MLRRIALTGAMLLGFLVPVSVYSTAEAYTCGAEVQHQTSSTVTGNLIVAGRPTTFTLQVDARECSDRDRITEIRGRVHKSNPSCTSGPWINDAYKLNPNIISDWNPSQVTLTCYGTRTDYLAIWTPPSGFQDVFASMTADNRCVAMNWIVAVTVQADPNGVTPTICFNGA